MDEADETGHLAAGILGTQDGAAGRVVEIERNDEATGGRRGGLLDGLAGVDERGVEGASAGQCGNAEDGALSVTLESEARDSAAWRTVMGGLSFAGVDMI